MLPARTRLALRILRGQVARIEAGGRDPQDVLPFGVGAVDRLLPRGGVRLGALHEVAGGGLGAVDGAAAVLFAAGLAARGATRTPGQAGAQAGGQGGGAGMKQVLWCVGQADLFAPALQQAGLGPDQVVYVDAGADGAVLACAEDGLRHGSLGAVVAEVARLPMTASRRLHLAAEASGTLALVVHRWRRPEEAGGAGVFGQPTAAVTRWRVSAVPSAPLPGAVPGVGRARWRVELLRSRAGACGEWVLDACDEKGCLALPADLADGSAAAAPGARRALGG